MPPRIRLIALDLDGTMLDPSGNVSPRVLSALDRAAAAGVRVVVATGRRYRSSREIAERLPATRYVIAHHGAVVKSLEDDETVHSALLPMDLSLEAAGLMRGEGLDALVFVDGFEEGIDFYVAAAPGAGEADDFAGRYPECWRPLEEGRRPPFEGAAEVVALGQPEELEAAGRVLEAELGDAAAFQILKSPRYEYYFLEVLSPAAGKGKALLELAGRLEIRAEETGAVGDDLNDLNMFAAAGVSAAMADAPEEVRAAADFVVPSNADDGAAEAISRLLERRL